MTRFSPISGTTSASVPIAAILTKAGSQPVRPALATERLNELERDADASEVLVRIRAIVPLGIDDGERWRQRRIWFVVIRDDQVQPEQRRAALLRRP